MSFKAEDWDFIYTQRKNNNSYDLMVFNPNIKKLYFKEAIKEKYLNGTDSFGNPYHAQRLSPKTFDIIFNKLFNDYGCSEGFFYAETKENIESKPEVSKDVVSKGIKGELTPSELHKIVQKTPEKADYYDFEAFVKVIKRFLGGEISEEYYKDWTILVSWALAENIFKEDSEKDILYQNLSWSLDGHSLDDLENEEQKTKECMEMLAKIKYNYHLVKNVGKHNKPKFYNENKVVVYVKFDFCNQSNAFYRVCVANEKDGVFTIKNLANVEYLENVNYTFVDNDDFEDLKSEYYEIMFDKNMDISDYIIEGEYFY